MKENIKMEIADLEKQANVLRGGMDTDTSLVCC